MQVEKRVWYNKQLMDLKKEFRHNNLRTAYEYVRKIREGYKPGTDLCKETRKVRH